MMGDAGAWWSIQPFLEDEDSNPRTSNPIQQAKAEEVARGTVRAFEEGRAEGVNMAFGTEYPYEPRCFAKSGPATGEADPLHAATRSASHGHWQCRRAACDVRSARSPIRVVSASSPRARMPTSSSGTAILKPISISSMIPPTTCASS